MPMLKFRSLLEANNFSEGWNVFWLFQLEVVGENRRLNKTKQRNSIQKSRVRHLIRNNILLVLTIYYQLHLTISKYNFILLTYVIRHGPIYINNMPEIPFDCQLYFRMIRLRWHISGFILTSHKNCIINIYGKNFNMLTILNNIRNFLS